MPLGEMNSLCASPI